MVCKLAIAVHFANVMHSCEAIYSSGTPHRTFNFCKKKTRQKWAL